MPKHLLYIHMAGGALVDFHYRWTSSDVMSMRVINELPHMGTPAIIPSQYPDRDIGSALKCTDSDKIRRYAALE